LSSMPYMGTFESDFMLRCLRN